MKSIFGLHVVDFLNFNSLKELKEKLSVAQLIRSLVWNLFTRIQNLHLHQ